MTGGGLLASLEPDSSIRRLRPDDLPMVLSETDASPIHVGALLMLDVPQVERIGLTTVIRRQLTERLTLVSRNA